MNKVAQALLRFGLRLPGTEQGIACAGTPIESRTVKARGKAFLFVGPKDARLKLRDSLPAASALASRTPELCEAGAGGWVKLSYGPGLPANGVLERWVQESWRLITADAPASSAKKGATKKRSAR